MLDIGSGDGKLTARIADYLPYGQVLGIDNSLSMLAQARLQFMDPPMQRFSCEQYTL